jgi:hypothetical protein
METANSYVSFTAERGVVLVRSITRVQSCVEKLSIFPSVTIKPMYKITFKNILPAYLLNLRNGTCRTHWAEKEESVSTTLKRKIVLLDATSLMMDIC